MYIYIGLSHSQRAQINHTAERSTVWRQFRCQLYKWLVSAWPLYISLVPQTLVHHHLVTSGGYGTLWDVVGVLCLHVRLSLRPNCQADSERHITKAAIVAHVFCTMLSAFWDKLCISTDFTSDRVFISFARNEVLWEFGSLRSSGIFKWNYKPFKLAIWTLLMNLWGICDVTLPLSLPMFSNFSSH